MFFVANWKMFLSGAGAVALYQKHKKELDSLAADSRTTLVLCPPATGLMRLHELTQDSNIALGAQTCSMESFGAYTGFIAAQDFAEIGCRYMLVGHSEQRLYAGETDAMVGAKVVRVLAAEMVPIICVGESLADRQREKTIDVLKMQVKDALEAIVEAKKIIIAYEPIWAIGTGITPTAEQIEEVFVWMRDYCTQFIAIEQVLFLYGGSVSAQSVEKLQKIKFLQGFLIGKASLDFQEFKKIVDCSMCQGEHLP